MSKKKTLIAVLILIFIGLFFLWSNNNKVSKEITSPLQPVSYPTSQPEEGPLKTYEDSAGFSFKYPESLTVSTVPAKDENVYSWLKISSPEREEKILIKAEDTELNSLDDWFAQEGKAAGGGPSREVVLADILAKQIQYPKEKKLITVAIDEGILYLIEGPLDEGAFWNRAQNTIVLSFNFLNNQQKTEGQTQSAGEEAIYEEEEIVE